MRAPKFCLDLECSRHQSRELELVEPFDLYNFWSRFTITFEPRKQQVLLGTTTLLSTVLCREQDPLLFVTYSLSICWKVVSRSVWISLAHSQRMCYYHITCFIFTIFDVYENTNVGKNMIPHANMNTNEHDWHCRNYCNARLSENLHKYMDFCFVLCLRAQGNGDIRALHIVACNKIQFWNIGIFSFLEISSALRVLRRRSSATICKRLIHWYFAFYTSQE